MRAGRIGFIVLLGFVAAIVLVRTSEALQDINNQDSAKAPQLSHGKQTLDVEGKWLITFEAIRGVQLTRILTLHQENGGLTGTLDAPVCPCVVVGNIKGDKLKLKITPQTPGVATIYTATVTGDTMRGESRLEGIANPGSKFKGIRQVQTDPPSNSTKN